VYVSYHCKLTYQQEYSKIYVRFASNVTGVGDEVSDVTSVSTVLQQCTGKVVRLYIIKSGNYLQYYCYRLKHYHGTGRSDGAM